MDYMQRDMRRLPPRNSRGEFRRRRSRRDRGMDYARGDGRVIRSYPQMDYASDMNYDMARGGRGRRDMARDYGDYEDMRGDMRSDYPRQGGYDGHYPQGQGSTYYPIQAMGTFEGYYGMPEQDYARGGRGRGGQDYGYDMRYDMRGGDYARGRGRDYGYDYGYDGYGDYGETLSDKELEEWCHKLKSKLTEQEKQMFSKEAIMQRAKAMGVEFKDFTEMEFYVNTLKNYTDHKHSIGQNPDLAMKLSRDDFKDEDGEYKGSEWLSVYFDTFVDLDK